MADEEQLGNDTGKKSHMTRFIGGGVLLCVLLASVFFWVHRSEEKTAPVGEGAAGIVDMKRVMEAHNAYGQLASLQEERDAIARDLAVARRMAAELIAPKPGKEPFDAAVRQKAKTEEAHAREAAMARLDAAEKAEREREKVMLQKARDEINAEYFNEIFNIQLKLDNAAAMRLSDEAIAVLKERLRALQAERGRRQLAMWRAHEEKIKAYRAELAEREGIKDAARSAQTKEQLRAQEAAKKSAAEARNIELMQEKLLDTSKLRARIRERTRALRAKEKEIEALESRMVKEIAGKAAKLAAIHRLVIIYANPAPNIVFTRGERLGFDVSKTSRVIASGAVDLTDELIREFQ